MANKKPWEEEPNSRYRPDTLRLAGRNDAAYQTEKLANEVYDLGYDEGKTANQAAVDKAIANAASNSNGVPTSVKPTTNPASYQAAIKTAEKKDLVSKDLLDEYMNRGKFSYNEAADPLWQQYRQQYLEAGNKAMKDTLGKAVSLTGGHDNSYANAVAQQVNDDYAARAADKIPELYQLALDRYNQEGQDILNKYELLYGRESDADERAYRDRVLERQILESDREFNFNVEKFGKEYALNVRSQDLAEKVANHDMTMDELRFILNEKVANHEMSTDDARLIMEKAESEAKIDQIRADIDLGYRSDNRADRELTARINNSYYSGSGSPDGSGSSPTTTPKAGYNSDGTKKRTDKEIQAAADGLWKDYLKAEGSTKTLDTFMTRLLNQYSDDADRIMSTLENRAAAIDDRITRKGSKTYAYLD